MVRYATTGGGGDLRDAPPMEVPLADAGRAISALIGSGHHRGYVAIGRHRLEMMLSAGDGRVTLLWPTPDAWSNDRWADLTLDILRRAREGGASPHTNLDAIT